MQAHVTAARTKNPALAVPEAMPALLALSSAVQDAGLPQTTLNLVYLRASQLNGSSWNVQKHSEDLRQGGESPARLATVAAWRDSAHFTEAERAALALAEAATRLSDQTDAVPDGIWDEAARQYTETELAALLLAVGLSNLWHRLIVPTRQLAERPAD